MFNVGGKLLQFVTEFKYLGHIITCTLSDYKDLYRENKHTNILIYILFYTVLVSVPRKSRSGYLGHTVYVCLVLHCGILTLLNA